MFSRFPEERKPTEVRNREFEALCYRTHETGSTERKGIDKPDAETHSDTSSNTRTQHEYQYTHIRPRFTQAKSVGHSSEVLVPGGAIVFVRRHRDFDVAQVVEVGRVHVALDLHSDSDSAREQSSANKQTEIESANSPWAPSAA